MKRMMVLSSLSVCLLVISACTTPPKNEESEPVESAPAAPTKAQSLETEEPAPASADTADKPATQSIDSLIPGLADEHAAVRGPANEQLEQLCTGVLQSGDESERAIFRSQIIERLDADTPSAARIALVRQLARIGSDDVVEPLATLLSDDDEALQAAALQALRKNPSKQVRPALEAALTNAKTNEQRIALINILGERRELESVPALTTYARSSDTNVALAAINTLGDMGGSRSRFALYRIWRNEKSTAKDAAEAALLKLADTEFSQGKKTTAARLYQDLYQYCRHDSTYFAALRGMAKSQGPRALALLIELMKSDDHESAEQAARIALEIPGEVVTLTLSMLMAELPVHVQAVILEGLGKRGDATSRSTALNGLKHEDPRVRLAALQTLGAMSDNQDIPLLAKVAAKGPEQERDVAVRALAAWRSVDALNPLLLIVRTSDEPTPRMLALEGYVRLATQPGAFEPSETCRLLENAMSAARASRGKKHVLTALGDARHLDALMMAELYLGKPELRHEAAIAMLKLSRSLANEHPGAALAAVGKVRAAVNEESFLKQADEAEAYIKSRAE